mmetsp:Transcript_9830/g.44726  ORF Transcript_9830/g.44726 Transcript_9830/m.44726 type:complete len:214 (-) Transcript_9830:1129-1770(-)
MRRRRGERGGRGWIHALARRVLARRRPRGRGADRRGCAAATGLGPRGDQRGAHRASRRVLARARAMRRRAPRRGCRRGHHRRRRSHRAVVRVPSGTRTVRGPMPGARRGCFCQRRGRDLSALRGGVRRRRGYDRDAPAVRRGPTREGLARTRVRRPLHGRRRRVQLAHRRSSPRPERFFDVDYAASQARVPSQQSRARYPRELQARRDALEHR